MWQAQGAAKCAEEDTLAATAAGGGSGAGDGGRAIPSAATAAATAATAGHGRGAGRGSAVLSGLSWLDRLLPVWIVGAMILGVVLGSFVPQVGVHVPVGGILFITWQRLQAVTVVG